jgi:hypothetical protein
MKKALVVVVMGACFLGFAPGASAQISVDFDTYFSNPTLGLVGYTLTSDNDADGMVDSVAYALIAAILADTGQPTYGAVSAAWTTNLASLVPVQVAVAGVYGAAAGTAVQYIMAGGLTRGDNAYVLAALTGLGLAALMPGSPVSAGSAVGTTGDADSDGISNLQEYTNAGGVKAQFVTNALTPDVLSISTQPVGGTTYVGQNRTLTVVAINGTPPLHYQWKKGVTDVGTDSASYTITNAQLTDSGSYTCTVTDSDTPTPASVTSDAAVVDVVELGAVPASGIIGLITLGTLCLGAGVIALRRRR